MSLHAASAPSIGFALALALLCVDGSAGASVSKAKHHHHHKRARLAREAKPRECVKPPVELAAGTEKTKVSLAKCDGSALAAGVGQLSSLARAPRDRQLDPGLVERLQAVVDRFRKGNEPTRIWVESGYRPRSEGGYHGAGRALDFRIDGVENETVVAYCKTLPDTGCGYYPNNAFVHMDVRDPNTGHVSWTDVSRPGEPPHYLSSDIPADSATALPPLPALDPIAPDPFGEGQKDKAGRNPEPSPQAI